jgi:hypothetical protein
MPIKNWKKFDVWNLGNHANPSETFKYQRKSSLNITGNRQKPFIFTKNINIDQFNEYYRKQLTLSKKNIWNRTKNREQRTENRNNIIRKLHSHWKSSEIIEIIRWNRKPLEIIENHQNSSENIKYHQKHKEIINKHQKASKIIENHRKS